MEGQVFCGLKYAGTHCALWTELSSRSVFVTVYNTPHISRYYIMRKHVRVFSNSKISLHLSVQHTLCRRILLNKIVVILRFKLFTAFYGTRCGSVHKNRHTLTQLHPDNILTPYLIRTHFKTIRLSQSSFFQMVTLLQIFQLILRNVISFVRVEIIYVEGSQ